MARMISSAYTPKLAFTLRTLFLDGSYSDRVFHIGNAVEDLRYVDNGKIKTISGILKDIKYTVSAQAAKRKYNNLATVKSYFSEDVVVKSITIDASSEHASAVIEIPARELLEDANVFNVDRMLFFLEYGLNFSSEMSDCTHNEFSFYEGAYFEGMTYLGSTRAPINTTLAAITYDTETLEPQSLICVDDNNLRTIDLITLVNVKNVYNDYDTDNVDINDVMHTYNTIKLGAGTTDQTIVIHDDATIIGNNPAISANTRKMDNASFDETILAGSFDCEPGASLTLIGLTLTKDALINANYLKSLTLKNCIIEDLVAPNRDASEITISGGTPVKVEITGCYFGNPNDENGHGMKNGFEFNSPLKDGSIISKNYFDDIVARNNIICVYGVEDGATITISNNTFEFSGNGIRISPDGSAKANFIIDGNTYNETYTTTYSDYAGLVVIEPHESKTKSFANCVVNISNTKHDDDKQVWYLYCGRDDTKITKALQPTVILDGAVVMHPEVEDRADTSSDPVDADLDRPVDDEF